MVHAWGFTFSFFGQFWFFGIVGGTFLSISSSFGGARSCIHCCWRRGTPLAFGIIPFRILLFLLLGLRVLFQLVLWIFVRFLVRFVSFRKGSGRIFVITSCCFQSFFDKCSILILLREFNFFINLFHQWSWRSLTRPFSSWSVLVNG